MLADLRVEYGQQSLELVHLDLQDLELVDEDLFEPVFHQVLEDPIGVFLILGLDVDVPCKVVHPLAV